MVQVGNFRVEPPGLFRGRGEHPKMGKLKRRIYPRDITINIGLTFAMMSGPSLDSTWPDFHGTELIAIICTVLPPSSSGCATALVAAADAVSRQGRQGCTMVLTILVTTILLTASSAGFHHRWPAVPLHKHALLPNLVAGEGQLVPQHNTILWSAGRSSI